MRDKLSTYIRATRDRYERSPAAGTWIGGSYMGHDTHAVNAEAQS